MDLLGSPWEKEISFDRLAELEAELPELLSELERLLPAWDLDINCHMMLHLVEHILLNGPCWTWSMFGYERLWGRLMKWMPQTSQFEATMLNAFKAFKTATAAAPELYDHILDEQVRHCCSLLSCRMSVVWLHRRQAS